KVPGPVEVIDVILGALIVILNCLVAVASSPVAVTVNVDVVSVPTAFAVPVIAPVDDVIERPAGNEPIVTAKLVAPEAPH
mgnify:CR=1